MDMFDTRILLPKVETLLKPEKFLIDTFFTNVRVFDTSKVSVDIVKGHRKMAPLVHKNGANKNVGRKGYETNTYVPPTVAPMKPTEAEDLLKRLAGEPIMGVLSPDARAAQLLVEDLVDLDDMIRRREEWMCAQALFKGKLVLVNTEEGIDDTFDFGLTNKETLKVPWDSPNGTPVDDAKRAKLIVRQKSGLTVNVAVMNSTTANAFINSPQVQKIVSTFRDLRIPELNPQMLSEAVTFIAYLPEAGITICSYDEWFFDEEEGKEKPMIEDGYVLFADKNSNFDFLYGACAVKIDNVMTTVASTRVPRSWVEDNPVVRQLAINCRPLPVINKIDGIYVMEVLKK